MDKDQAIHDFWSGFGLPAYDENTVPDDAQMPYITYSVATGSVGNIIPLSGSLWYNSLSWAEISQKAEQISQAVSYGFYSRKIDGGYLWITRGSPFSRRMSDENDDVRRIYFNLNAEFLTAN